MIINYKTHNTTEYNLSRKGFDKMDKILSGILMLIVWIITILAGILFNKSRQNSEN